MCTVVALALIAGCSASDGGFVVARDRADEMGYTWPLTVDRGVVTCHDGKQLVLTVDGTEYALNGLAKDAGFEPIEPIWADDPEVDGLKIEIGSLIAWANEACDF